jgi:hypothetical protein
MATAAIVALSLQGGGGYDLVTRHEAGILGWLVLAVGLIVGVLPMGRPRWTQYLLLGALMALLTWTALSLAWTDSNERTTVEIGRVVFYIGVVALVAGFVDRGNWREVLAGLYCVVAVVLALALLSRVFPDAFPTGYLTNGRPGKRLGYPFGYWNALGCFVAMLVGPALLISASERRLTIRALALSTLAIAVPVGYLTYSRGAIGATALALVVALLVSRSRWTVLIHAAAAAAVGALAVAVIRAHSEIAFGRAVDGRWALLGVVGAGLATLAVVGAATGRLGLDRRARLPTRVGRPMAAVGVVAVVAVAVVIGPGLTERAWDSFTETTETTSSTDAAARLSDLSGPRIKLWRSALRAADDEIAHGIGAGTFEFWWDRDPHYAGYVRDAHNLYLETLAELGIVGLALLAAVLLAALIGVAAAARSLPDETAAYAFAALATAATWALVAGYDWMWESTAVTTLMLGAVASALASGSLPRQAGLPLWGRAIGVLGCLLATIVLLPSLASTSQVRGSEQAAARGDLDLALSRARDAVGDEPWASTPYLQRALVEELRGELRASAQDAQRAADREPVNYRPWLILARVQAERGWTGAALAAYRRAKEAKPAIAKRFERPGG